LLGYLALKVLHVVAAMVFLGTGLGSAWYRWRADRSGSPAVVLWCQEEIVRADLYFTVPAAVALIVSGGGMVHTLGLSWSTPWVMAGAAGFATSGLFWLPAVYLQLELRRLARQACARGEPLPPRYWRAARAWALLGVPSFGAALLTVWAMVAKDVFLGLP
jgi:uncharacterized membrane protein